MTHQAEFEPLHVIRFIFYFFICFSLTCFSLPQRLASFEPRGASRGRQPLHFSRVFWSRMKPMTREWLQPGRLPIAKQDLWMVEFTGSGLQVFHLTEWPKWKRGWTLMSEWCHSVTITFGPKMFHVLLCFMNTFCTYSAMTWHEKSSWNNMFFAQCRSANTYTKCKMRQTHCRGGVLAFLIFFCTYSTIS